MCGQVGGASGCGGGGGDPAAASNALQAMRPEDVFKQDDAENNQAYGADTANQVQNADPAMLHR